MTQENFQWRVIVLPVAMTIEEYNKLRGGHVAPVKHVNGLCVIDAYWRRRDRKHWKRYQKQKRKQ